ncbi:MAG: DUF1292 domain-containing protein [Clostridiales bacterium]|nr:DUF1292 domain-containing protein [Clostridiales bacterium]
MENITPNTEEQDELITLELEDGTKVDCEIFGIFDFEEQDYIALVPQDGSEDIYLYGYKELSDDEFELTDIEDDELFEKVSTEFERLVDEAAEEE